MSVELRCPECRTRLRLAEHPDPGTEVECPECTAVFAAPDPDTGEVPDARGRKPAKRRPADADDRPAKKPADKPKPAAAKPTAGPKKRKAKKLKTNKGLLWALIGGGVLFVGVMAGLLIWYFTRVPPAVEMLGYLPEDCTQAYGANVEHLRKYPEFAKKAEQVYNSATFKAAADALAKAMGEDVNAILRIGVQGNNKSGSAGVVLRTLKDVPDDALGKLPAASPGEADGVKYYTATLDTLGRVRVFRPTPRLVVFASGGVSESAFRNMLKGNKENYDRTLLGRCPGLAKRTVRGTAWQLWLFDGDKPPPPGDNARGDVAGNALQTHISGIAGSAKGMGLKASVGSKSIRFELLFLMNDAEGAKDQYQKFKDSTLSNQDAEEPPKWWKDMMNSVGNKKIQAEVLSNAGASYSGEVFWFKTQGDTKIMLESVTGLVGIARKITDGPNAGNAFGPPGAPAGGLGGAPGGDAGRRPGGR